MTDIIVIKGTAVGMTTSINVGNIGHEDYSAPRVMAALRQLRINMIVAGESFRTLGDALDKLEIYDAFVNDERPYMLEMIDDVRAEADIFVKPQPFWTQQGRHKKGGRGRY